MSTYFPSLKGRPILDETQDLRSRRRTLAADALHELPARAPLRHLRARPPEVPQLWIRVDVRDRHWARVLPVLHLRQARAQGLGRQDRRARPGARAARHDRAP